MAVLSAPLGVSKIKLWTKYQSDPAMTLCRDLRTFVEIPIDLVCAVCDFKSL